MTRKQVYKVTYPNGKIYVGMDLTGTISYFGSPSASAKERIATDLAEHRLDLTVRKEILWESETATDDHVRLESILATVHRLVGVARLGVDGGDHPIRGHVLRDTPWSVGAIGALDRFDVLASDQRQQRHRVGSLGAEFGLRQMAEDRCASPTRASRSVAGAGVVPGDLRFTRVVVVMSSAVLGDDLGGTGDFAADPADRADQLGDGVLGGDRVVEDRGTQCPSGLARKAPVAATTVLTASKIRFGDAEAVNLRRQYVNVVA